MNRYKNENVISKLIVEFLLEEVTNENICIIGSTAACLLSSDIKEDKFFMKKRGYDSRDIDILCYSPLYPRLIKKLIKFGVPILREYNGEYSLLSTKGISKIVKCKLEVGNNTKLGSFLLQKLLNISKVDIYIDIIILTEKNMFDVTKNWAIGDLSRNFCLYKSGYMKTLVIKMLTDVKINKKLLMPSIGNMIEWISSYIHLYGGKKIGYTPTGDKYNIIYYGDRDKKYSSEKSLDILSMMNLIRSGDTIQMIDMPELVYWRNNELINSEKFNNMYGEEGEKILKNYIQGNCGICLEVLKDINNNKVVLSCNHIYCLKCILNMLKKYLIFRLNMLNNFIAERDEEHGSMYNKCPICRKELVNISSNKMDIIENGFLKCKDIKLSSGSVYFFKF